eukprot:CAMPEP_0117590532 /NCGR_PEP_ID=MMETSP0784-20121206/71029_1 /TAXON_ID=39447 /ORGANISM="" /LENGTH=39 /DNA_ID= /DNA_START= /DNA_END= /DNA_ORIENTATION=
MAALYVTKFDLTPASRMASNKANAWSHRPPFSHALMAAL